MHNVREARWKDEMRKVTDERERIEVLLAGVMGIHPCYDISSEEGEDVSSLGNGIIGSSAGTEGDGGSDVVGRAL